MNKSAEAFRTIGEVADELDVPKHVLRFWEGKFPQIRPMKRGGGRRYYRPEDMELLRGIRHLLHAEGYTIKGVQKILREHGIEQVKTLIREGAGSKAAAKKSAAAGRKAEPPKKAAPVKSARGAQSAPPAVNTEAGREHVIAAVIAELEYCRAVLTGAHTEARAVPQQRGRGRS